MKQNILFFASWLLFVPALSLAQVKVTAKKTAATQRNYSFITLPMMTEATAMPTKEGALKAAMHTFMEWDANAAANLAVTCTIVKVHDLTLETTTLAGKLPNGNPDFKTSVEVPLKYSHVTWDAEMTVTKDITLSHLWFTVGQLIDFHLLSYFEQHLDKAFHERIYKAIYTDGIKDTYVLKAGEKFKITNIHSYIAAEAKSDNWMCYILKDDLHPGNYQADVASLALNKVTTLDAKTINVDYTITKAAAKEIHFEVFRSETQTKQDGDNSTLIADMTANNPDQLTVGVHTGQTALNIALLPDKDLAPDTRMPFIVVVATCSGQKSTTYFRKWLLGAVAHGFDRWALHESPFPIPDWAWIFSLQDFTLPSWETMMANQLKQKDGYDDVFAFDWMKTCGLNEHGWAEKKGDTLADEILDWIKTHQKHQGDVVDIHLIGHSRGTVVVTQTLKKLSLRLKTDVSAFGGSYVELTLLDPHPACNDYEKPWGNWDLGGSPATQMPKPDLDYCGLTPKALIAKALADGFIFAKDLPADTHYCQYHEHERLSEAIAFQLAAQGATLCFQEVAKDSKIEITAGVKRVDVFFQHTPAYQLCGQPNQEYIQNLWGMVSPATLSSLDSTIPINKTDLTNVDIDGIGIIGHNEVPLVYEQLWVGSGTLNRSQATANAEPASQNH